MTIAVTRLDLSVSELRRKARRSDDADQARRILAIALVLEGGSREAAGTQRQTLRDWIVRYNAEGLEGPAEAGTHAEASRRQSQGV